MKKIKVTNNSQIFIYNAQDSVLIITSGTESPFYYTENLKKILKDYGSNEKEITIYVDMLSCVKNENQRFIKLNYSKKKELLDTSSIENIKYMQIPKIYKDKIKKVYSAV